jgi:hypothetical protein
MSNTTAMIKRCITIWVEGDMEGDFESAFETALASIEAGNTSGSDRNPASSYSFEVDDVSELGDMQVSLDGGVNYAPAKNGVRVIYTDIPHPADVDDSAELHVNLTGEGIIADLIASGECVGTRAEMATDIASEIAEEWFRG